MIKIEGIPFVAYCELCDVRTPICEECYNADTPWDAGCAYCHSAYGCEEELI